RLQRHLESGGVRAAGGGGARDGKQPEREHDERARPPSGPEGHHGLGTRRRRSPPCPRERHRSSGHSGAALESGGRGRVAQWESARFTRERSLVRNQPRPSGKSLLMRGFHAEPASSLTGTRGLAGGFSARSCPLGGMR